MRFRGFTFQCPACRRSLRAETIIGLEAAALAHVPKCQDERADRIQREVAAKLVRLRQGNLFGGDS